MPPKSAAPKAAAPKPAAPKASAPKAAAPKSAASASSAAGASRAASADSDGHGDPEKEPLTKKHDADEDDGIDVENLIEQAIRIRLPRLTKNGTLAAKKKPKKASVKKKKGQARQKLPKAKTVPGLEDFAPQFPPTKADLKRAMRKYWADAFFLVVYIAGALGLAGSGGGSGAARLLRETAGPLWSPSDLAAYTAGAAVPERFLESVPLSMDTPTTLTANLAANSLDPALTSSADLTANLAANALEPAPTSATDLANSTARALGSGLTTAENATGAVAGLQSAVSAAAGTTNASGSGSSLDTAKDSFATAKDLKRQVHGWQSFILRWWVLGVGLAGGLGASWKSASVLSKMVFDILDKIQRHADQAIDSMQEEIEDDIEEMLQEVIAGMKNGPLASMMEKGAAKSISQTLNVQVDKAQKEMTLISLIPYPFNSRRNLTWVLLGPCALFAIFKFIFNYLVSPPQYPGRRLEEVASDSTVQDLLNMWTSAALNILFGFLCSFPFIRFMGNYGLGIIERNVNDYLLDFVKKNIPGGVEGLQKLVDAVEGGGGITDLVTNPSLVMGMCSLL